MQVAQRYAQTNRGVVIARLHRIFDVHGGFSRRHEELVMDVVYDDGAIVKVRVWQYAINGKPATASDVASLRQSWEHPKSGDAFAPPFDPRNLSSYHYQSAGPASIAFSSSVRDPGHGSGRFTYDAQNDVVSFTFQPNVLPPHAGSGEIADRRSEVLPEYWAVTDETQTYRGSYGPFPAAGTVQVNYSDFRRFPDVASAVQSL
jgi:hypothetical protein